MVRDATVRADRLVDSLLLLARRPSGCRRGRPCASRSTCRSWRRPALAAVAGEARDRGLQVATSYGPGARAAATRGLLERLAGNLVENAVRHNVDGGWVRVDTGTVEGRARLRSSSSGPVVPTRARWRRCSSRSARTAPPARPGAAPGLGLAIVRAVAEVARRYGRRDGPARPAGWSSRSTCRSAA